MSQGKIKQGEKRFYKGIYPVKVIEPTSDGKTIKVKAERPFLDTSNYSSEKKPIKAGETFTTPSWKLWPEQRRVGR
jgi:hypothetical protein